MASWNKEELALAIRLTGVIGYNFTQSARILVRHGFPQRQPREISEKIKTDCPDDWKKVEAIQLARKSQTLCGVTAPPPQRRYQKNNEELVEFIKSLPSAKTTGSVCWEARKAGFDCNVTDIVLSGNRAEYIFSTFAKSGISFEEAIDRSLCLWPMEEGFYCGEPRERNSYCGEHHCRGLGNRAGKKT